MAYLDQILQLPNYLFQATGMQNDNEASPNIISVESFSENAHTVDSEIIARILFSRIALKYILVI